MRNAEGSIERRDDRTLRTGLSTKLLRRSTVSLYSFIGHPLGKRRVIFPAMNIRPHTVIVDVRIAAFRHAQQCCIRALQGGCDGGQMTFQFLPLLRDDRSLSWTKGDERWCDFRLNVHVD